MSQDRKAGGAAREPKHNAVTIAHEQVGIDRAAARVGDDFEASPVERVSWIGHLDPASAGGVRSRIIRVVERGIKNSYRWTTSRTA